MKQSAMEFNGICVRVVGKHNFLVVLEKSQYLCISSLKTMIPPVYTYDAHGNMTKIPNISNMIWDYKDQLISAVNGTSFTSYLSYDDKGNRTRKVVVKGNIREERYYIGAYEVYRKYIGSILNTERKSVNVADDEKVFVRIETETGQTPVVRYQYDNHLGSACLELDTTGLIISYEEYHPFGTTSYRSGRNATEVSLKRYKYCGKEKDEETGLYYYGARYYAAWLCRFVSCDPLKEKYPNLSPYTYCANNPVKYIDPDGREIVPTTKIDPETGKKTVTINLTGVVSFDHLSTNVNDKQGYVDSLNKEINNTFSKNFEKENTEVIFQSNLRLGTDNDILPEDHAIYLTNLHVGPNKVDQADIGGFANMIGGKVAYLPKSRDLNVAVHEVGHLLGLGHPSDITLQVQAFADAYSEFPGDGTLKQFENWTPDKVFESFSVDNVMHQYGDKNTKSFGSSFDYPQLNAILEAELNQGSNKWDFQNDKPAKNPYLRQSKNNIIRNAFSLTKRRD